MKTPVKFTIIAALSFLAVCFLMQKCEEKMGSTISFEAEEDSLKKVKIKLEIEKLRTELDTIR